MIVITRRCAPAHAPPTQDFRGGPLCSSPFTLPRPSRRQEWQNQNGTQWKPANYVVTMTSRGLHSLYSVPIGSHTSGARSRFAGGNSHLHVIRITFCDKRRKSASRAGLGPLFYQLAPSIRAPLQRWRTGTWSTPPGRPCGSGPEFVHVLSSSKAGLDSFTW